MIEIKLSQGAKPGHGGVLPGAEGHARDRRGARRAAGRRLHLAGRATARSRRRSRCCSSSRGCASCRAASRSASSSASATRGNGSASPRRCSRPASCPTSSSSTAPKAAPARRRSSSPTTSARRCRKACCSCTTRWSALDLRDTHPHRLRRQGRQRVRHRAHAGARRRLVQRGARLHVRARLHPVADLPHRPLPDRRDDAGPAARRRRSTCRQGRARAQLPPATR